MSEKPSFKIRFDVIGVFGILVGLAGLYTYYKGTRPQFEIVVESATNVVDVNERIVGLGVLFNGDDLLKQNKALTIYSVSMRNSGNESIRKGDFDEDALVGITLPGANILSAQVDAVRTTAEPYIRTHAQLKLSRPDTVQLLPLIVDPGAEITLRVVAIHNSSYQPRVIATGKVVGQKEIPVLIGKAESQNSSIWQRAFGGGLGVNLLRLPSYFFAFILLSAFAIGIPVALASWFKKRKRKRSVRAFFNSQSETPGLRWFANTYVEEGISPLKDMLSAASEPNKRPRFRSRFSKGGVGITEAIEFASPAGVAFYPDGMGPFGAHEAAKRAGLISQGADNRFVTNESLMSELQCFINSVPDI